MNKGKSCCPETLLSPVTKVTDLPRPIPLTLIQFQCPPGLHKFSPKAWSLLLLSMLPLPQDHSENMGESPQEGLRKRQPCPRLLHGSQKLAWLWEY